MAAELTLEERIAAVVVDKLSELIAKLETTRHGWPELMTLKTAAAYMDRTVPSVRSLIEGKVLPTCKIDRRVQLRRQDIDRLIERHTS